MPAVVKQSNHSKRGDTIIEVMFAFAIFSLIAIISVSMMNIGLAASERSLELVTARNELNAQAEALRFIHSSYISEATLPTCDAVAAGEKCQQYKELWEDRITARAIDAMTFNDATTKIEYPLMQCSEVYDNNNRKLVQNHAFVINTRKLNSVTSDPTGYANSAYIPATGSGPTADIFQEAPLNARIIYTDPSGGAGNSTQNMNTLTKYTRVARVEGIWVIAVKGPSATGGVSGIPQYYDFYIETCWNGSNTPVPTSLDTVIRLYNPAGV